jgi:hypothetical protein
MTSFTTLQHTLANVPRALVLIEGEGQALLNSELLKPARHVYLLQPPKANIRAWCFLLERFQ